MPSEEKMKEYIERILTNNPGYDRARKVSPKKLLKEQVDTLNRFNDFYAEKSSPRGDKTKTASIYSCLSQLRRLGLFLNNPYEKATQQDLIDYLGTIKHLKEKSKSGTRIVLRIFYKWMHNMHKPHEVPEIVDHPVLISKNVKVNKKPQALLNKDEIKRILDAAGNNRNKCLVMLSLGEGGMRSSEIVSANLDSVEFDERGAKFFTEKSKSTERFVRLIDSEPFLRSYINVEYRLNKKDKKNPLFYAGHGIGAGKRLGPNVVSSLLRQLAKKAAITKRIYCHLGRDINITRLNKLGMGSELIAKRHGITVKTMQSTYLRLDDKDADDAYTKIKDKLTNDEKKSLAEEEKKLSPRECPRCRERFPGNPEIWKHPATAVVCTCGMMLDGTKEHDLKQEFFSYMAQQFMQSSEKDPDLSMREFMRKVKEKI